MIRHLSKRERWIAFLTVLILVIAVAERTLLRPFVDLVRNQAGTVETRRFELARNLNLLVEETFVEREYEAISETLGLVLTPEEETARMLGVIQRIGQDARVEIQNIKPLTIRDGDFYKTFSLELECEGRIEDIARFLFEIGESEAGMRVSRMRLSAQRGSAMILKASMQISEVRLLTIL